jgi:hypothetical protein
MKSHILVGAAGLGLAAFAHPLPAAEPDSYIVHEWGTFSSLQDSHGALLPWENVPPDVLPSFVLTTGGKSSPARPGQGIAPNHRMETPVLYFYPSTEHVVDVRVQFRGGSMTEWYPNATIPSPSALEWRNIRFSVSGPDHTANLPPVAKEASHYYAARAVDAATLTVDIPGQNGIAQTEKFLFYRGHGNFPPPVTVSARSGQLLVKNNLAEPLTNVFAVSADEFGCSFQRIASLAPGATYRFEKIEKVNEITQLQSQLAHALEMSGLYPKEAQAMVKTWQHTWFEEPGCRILYILPGGFVQEILPITLTPAPAELVRVMVGRAEVFSRGREAQLTTLLRSATSGRAVDPRDLRTAAGRYLHPLASHLLRAANAETHPGMHELLHAAVPAGEPFD